MRTSKKKISVVFNVFLFAAILLIPATAFNVNAQEHKEKIDDYIKYDNDYNDNYQYNKDNYGKHNDKETKKSHDYVDSYKSHKEKKTDQITIIKELFICDDVLNIINNNEDNENNLNGLTSFDCDLNFIDFESFSLPVSPDSGRYLACNDELCPGIDESSFSAFVHKDIAFEQDLTSQGNTVNPVEFHYLVTEDEVDDRNGFDNTACGNFFTESLTFESSTENTEVEYDICVVYEGDCQGTIYPGEDKTCTIKNYIVSGEIEEITRG